MARGPYSKGRPAGDDPGIRVNARLRTALVERLRTHSFVTHISIADIISALLEENLPDYGLTSRPLGSKGEAS